MIPAHTILGQRPPPAGDVDLADPMVDAGPSCMASGRYPPTHSTRHRRRAAARHDCGGGSGHHQVGQMLVHQPTPIALACEFGHQTGARLRGPGRAAPARLWRSCRTSWPIIAAAVPLPNPIGDRPRTTARRRTLLEHNHGAVLAPPEGAASSSWPSSDTHSTSVSMFRPRRPTGVSSLCSIPGRPSQQHLGHADLSLTP